MSKRAIYPPILISLLLLVTHVGAQEEHPVQARLLAASTALEPGAVLRLGVELQMQEGWHTYWAFSGDAGMPTEVVWDLPPAFAAGALQWPLPHKYEEEGNLTVYGYADEVVLLTDIELPGSLVVGDTLRLAAEVSWLVCRELCIPGHAEVELYVPVGKGQPQHGALFARYQEQVPGALAANIELDYSARDSAGEMLVDLKVKGAAPFASGDEGLDFYPLAADDFEFRSVRVAAEQLQLSLRPYDGESIEQLRGVLVYVAAGQEVRQAGEVTLDLRAASKSAGLAQLDFSTSAANAQEPLLFYILLALVGGLILNLMPCVLPVISLKILSIVGQAGQERTRVRALGLAFAAGVVVSFMVLALVVVLLKSGGEQVGWGFQFQHPGFVAAMAALVFALGLSLFGVYTVNLPGASGSYASASSGEGLTSSFFNGVLATVLATPCTAPFLGTALGFAFAQSALLIALIFTCIGVGMALPYVLLAIEPAWTRFLPKPGAWMERFKQGMGFLLMATVLWLLWVLGKQIGVEGVIWTGAFLLGIALACWIIGQWLSLDAGALRRRVVWGCALFVVAFSYGVFLHPVLAVERALRSVDMPRDEEGLAWVDFSTAKVERLVRGGQTVFIDFTAEWCWTCKVNERAVLMDDEVRARFAEDDVALVKADWTNSDPEITRLLSAFGRSGVPLYVVFPGGRLDEPLVLPEIISVELVLDKLGQAAALRAGS
jgi:thiol:disulfide interchange protein/DsbC/DsbD-like thiol-disulfide interchange protein